MSYKDLILALLVVTIWGANFTVIKLGLDDVPPMLLVALRFMLASFPAIFFVRPPEIHISYLISYGVTVGVGQFGCLFYGMHIGMPAGAASVVLQSQAFFTLFFATIFLREAVANVQWLGLVVAAIGLGLVGHNDQTSVLAIPKAALMLTLCGAASWGLSNIIVRKASASAILNGRTLNMFSLVVWSSLIPPLPLLGLAMLLDSPARIVESFTHLNGISIFSIVYLAFGATLIGFGIWSKLLSKHSAGKVAPLSLFVPVTGLLTARIVLNEQFSYYQWAGCLCVILGLLVSSFGLPSFLMMITRYPGARRAAETAKKGRHKKPRIPQ
jgi:O-acetylserine/cysteine efflux transporter